MSKILYKISRLNGRSTVHPDAQKFDPAQPVLQAARDQPLTILFAHQGTV